MNGAVKRKWNTVTDQSNANYTVVNEIIYTTEVLKSNPCCYSDAYILVRGNITIRGLNNVTKVVFKKCLALRPLCKCITKNDGTMTDDAEHLDLVMLMYNSLEYSSDCSDTTGSL